MYGWAHAWFGVVTVGRVHSARCMRGEKDRERKIIDTLFSCVSVCSTLRA